MGNLKNLEKYQENKNKLFMFFYNLENIIVNIGKGVLEV